MSAKINREYRKLYKIYGKAELQREVILFSDSKGFAIKNIIPDRYKNIKVIAKKGATVNQRDHVRRLLNTAKYAREPIILIWLGTCELTTKDNTGKYIKLREFPYQNVELTLSEYRELKANILRVNRQAIVLYIECPYHSITRYNRERGKITDCNNNTVSITITPKHKGKHFPSLVVNKYKKKRQIFLASQIDNDLCSVIDYYNQHLRLINKKIATPRLAQDIISSRKGQKLKVTKYSKNWNLYNDGIHPSRLLANLWWYRLIELTFEVSEEC